MAAGRKTGGGSRKGRPNKVTASLKEMILGALQAKGGQRYLERCADENPTAFLTLLGRVLPAQERNPGGALLRRMLSTSASVSSSPLAAKR